MTEVKFFFNVEHKLNYACVIAKKAYDGGKKLVVYAPDTRLAAEFDRLLWTFMPLSFVPHVRSDHALAGDTPIIIATDDQALPHHEALLSLGTEPPPFFSRFEYLREIVTTDENDRQAARERSKFYTARGFHVDNIDSKTGLSVSKKNAPSHG